VYYTSDGRGDVLDVAGHQNIWLSEVIVTDILDPGQLSVMFSILDPVKLGGFRCSWRTDTLGAISELSLWTHFFKFPNSLFQWSWWSSTLLCNLCNFCIQAVDKRKLIFLTRNMKYIT
jgi:hypothetical protein